MVILGIQFTLICRNSRISIKEMFCGFCVQCERTTIFGFCQDFFCERGKNILVCGEFCFLGFPIGFLELVIMFFVISLFFVLVEFLDISSSTVDVDKGGARIFT